MKIERLIDKQDKVTLESIDCGACFEFLEHASLGVCMKISVRGDTSFKDVHFSGIPNTVSLKNGKTYSYAGVEYIKVVNCKLVETPKEES